MRIASLVALAFFVFAVVVQANDPDPLRWMLAYGLAAALALAAAFGRYFFWPTLIGAGLYVVAGWLALPSDASLSALSLSSFGMSSLRVEEVREGLGLFLCALWMLVLLVAMRSGRRGAAVLVVPLLAMLFAGCTAPIAIPAAPRRDLLARVRVAEELDNPRGMLPLPDGGLLVSLAGTGDPARPHSSALVRLADRNGDGHLDPPGGGEVLLARLPSRNILDIVRRDEVFGMAAIAEGGGETLASLGFFGGPSTIYAIEGGEARPWSKVHGNINALAYDPGRRIWLAVSSSSEEIVRLAPERGAERVVKIPPLSEGQDAVPGYLRWDPASGDMLVTLFSGSTQGEEGGDGTELVERAGGIVRVNPDTGETQWLVRGLTAPTDLAIGAGGELYVLEFCSDFLDPLRTREEMWQKPRHGGFRRFSGRLLRIDPRTGEVVVLAEGLDAPTNLALDGQELFIAEGMGTPGRPIPGPQGPVPLEGFIEKVTLPPAATERVAGLARDA